MLKDNYQLNKERSKDFYFEKCLSCGENGHMSVNCHYFNLKSYKYKVIKKLI